MKDLSTPQNKELYAVVSVGFNRIKSQKRLLESLKEADYCDFDNVPLVISIDRSGDEDLYRYVREFNWPYGDKYVIIQKERLGLKNHILSCGDLTKFFKGVILFEDDLFVSKYYYQYVMQMENAYGDCDRVASIGLYSNEMNGFCWLPFERLKNGADVYAIQSVCTWGEAWNERMWKLFKEWYVKDEIDWENLDVPEREKRWKNAWSKYFDAYLVLTNRYSIFPDVSLCTNFSDAGVHGVSKNGDIRFQSSLQYGEREYNTLAFDQLLHYDAHFNSLNLFSFLGTNREETCVDLYGNRENYNKRYYLTIQRKPYKILKSYGLEMRPIEMNIICDIPGDSIFFYDTSIPSCKPKSAGWTHLVMYYQKGFNSLLLWYVIKGNVAFIKKKAIEKIKKKFKIK